LLDLRVELVELSRLPGDARLGDRRRGVGAEAAGLDIQRFVDSGFLGRFVRGGFWLLLIERPSVLSERGVSEKNGGDAKRHACATRSSRQALRNSSRWHLSASRIAAILDRAACARLTRVDLEKRQRRRRGSLNDEIGLQRARSFDHLKDRDDPRRLDADPVQATDERPEA